MLIIQIQLLMLIKKNAYSPALLDNILIKQPINALNAHFFKFLIQNIHIVRHAQAKQFVLNAQSHHQQNVFYF